MRTFIVRLHEDAGERRRTGAAPPLRGVVDEVATGLRATFRNDHELVTALMTAVGTDPTGPSWDRGDDGPREAEPNEST